MKLLQNCNFAHLFVYHKNGAVHREPRCWHGDPNGLWEERCGLDSLRSEDTLGLLWKKKKKKEGVHISGKVQRDKIREIKAEKIVDIAKEEVKARE